MRSKAHRYSATVFAATFTTNTDVIGVTGDFDGGFVQANAVVTATGSAGIYVVAQFKVDGVAQGPQAALYWTAGNIVVIHAVTLRVPQGRHRISVLFTTNASPIASSSADMSVAELNA
jgi:hypothetical protein